ncbi:MAG TPA: hypothetical protein VH500_13585 [Nitrososphaeraceae archaeon]|jgi:hypothetical protein
MKCDRDFTSDDIDLLSHALRHQLEQIRNEGIRHNAIELLNLFIGLRKPNDPTLGQTIVNLPITIQELEWINDSLKAFDGISELSDNLRSGQAFVRLKLKVEEKLRNVKSLND